MSSVVLTTAPDRVQTLRPFESDLVTPDLHRFCVTKVFERQVARLERIVADPTARGRLRIEGHAEPDPDCLGSMNLLYEALKVAYGVDCKVAYFGDLSDSRLAKLLTLPAKSPIDEKGCIGLMVDAHDVTQRNVKGSCEHVDRPLFCWDHHHGIHDRKLYYIDSSMYSSVAIVFEFVRTLFERQPQRICLDRFFGERPRLAALLALGVLTDEKADFGHVLKGDLSQLTPAGAQLFAYLRRFTKCNLREYDIARDPRYREVAHQLLKNLAPPFETRSDKGERIVVHVSLMQGTQPDQKYVARFADAFRVSGASFGNSVVCMGLIKPGLNEVKFSIRRPRHLTWSEGPPPDPANAAVSAHSLANLQVSREPVDRMPVSRLAHRLSKEGGGNSLFGGAVVPLSIPSATPEIALELTHRIIEAIKYSVDDLRPQYAKATP